MRNYELTLLLKPECSEGAANDKLQQFSAFVQEQGGLLETQRVHGKRSFLPAGKLRKEIVLAATRFSFDPAKLDLLKQQIAKDKEVVRSVVCVIPVKKQKTERQRTREPLPSSAPLQEAQAPQEKIAVNINDIDKKLEEIFKEN